jgi:hypothetical protein
VNELFNSLRAIAGAPQMQIWFFIGLLAGFAYGWYRYRSVQKLLVTTTLVALPLLLWAALYNGYGLNVVTLFLVAIFFMLGVAGFGAGWLPGLLLGCLFGFLTDRNSSRRQQIERNE